MRCPCEQRRLPTPIGACGWTPPTARVDGSGRVRAADAGALVDCFGFPSQVVSVADDEAPVTVARGAEWPGVREGLLGAYGRLGVADCAPLALEVAEPPAAVRVHRALRREGGGTVYDFTAVYTLARADGRLRIVAVAHDELAKMPAP